MVHLVSTTLQDTSRHTPQEAVRVVVKDVVAKADLKEAALKVTMSVALKDRVVAHKVDLRVKVRVILLIFKQCSPPMTRTKMAN